MQPTPETCGACRYIEAAVLAGYGYCRAAQTPEERAKFLPRSGACMFTPSRYIAEVPHAKAPS